MSWLIYYSCSWIDHASSEGSPELAQHTSLKAAMSREE